MTKEEKKEYDAKRYLANKDKIKGQSMRYRVEHEEENKAYRKKYNTDHKQKIKIHNAEYYITHKREIKKYYLDNRERINADRLAYVKRKRLADPLYKMAGNLRKRNGHIFKKIGLHKSCKTKELLGADYQTVMRHIESQFIFGMSWENYGQWHIDHKKPLALAKTEEQLIKLCNYKNLQPLWAEENLRKRDKINFVVKEVRFG